MGAGGPQKLSKIGHLYGWTRHVLENTHTIDVGHIYLYVSIDINIAFKKK